MNEELVKVAIEADSSSFLESMSNASNALDGFGKVAGKIGGAIDRVEDKFKSVGKTITGIGASLVAMSVANSKSAGNFEASMANVYTIVDKGSSSVKGFKNAILDMSRRVPQSAITLSEGLYEISSSGIEAESAINVLDVSSRAASAGLTETGTSARAITSALNAYGMEAEKANWVSDVLFQTVNLGVLSFEDLSVQMGSWVGMAASAKVPLDDAASALAAMTLAGIPAAEASTALARTMQSFIKPGEGMVELVSQLGYESPATMLATLGLKGSIDAINKATGGTPEALSKVFLEVTALTGVMALGAGGGRAYNQIFADMTDRQKVAGSTARAFAEQSATLNHKMELLQNSFNAARIELGTYLLPIFKAMIGVLQLAFDTFDRLPGPIKFLISIMTLASSVVMTLGGLFLAFQLKGFLFKTAITKINATLGTSIPVMQSMARVLLEYGKRMVNQVPIIGKYTKSLQEKAKASGSVAKSSAAIVAGLAVAGMAFVKWSQNSKEATKQVVRDAEDARSAFRINSMEDIQNHATSLQTTFERTSQDINSTGRGFVGMLDVVGEGYKAVTGQATLYHEALGNAQTQEEIQATEELGRTLQSNLSGISGALGITRDEALYLANALGIDLTKAVGENGRYVSDVTDGVNQYTIKLDENGKAIKEAADQMQRGREIASGMSAQLIAIRGSYSAVTEASLELTDSQKDLHKIMQGIGSATAGYDEALASKEAALQKWGEKQVEAGTLTEEAFASLSENVSLSLAEYADSLAETNMELIAWENNLVTVSERAGADVAKHLANMGTDGIDLVEKMATGTDEEVERMKDQIILNMGLTGSNSAVELEAGMLLAEEKGRKGANATRTAIAEELGWLVQDVERISNRYGTALVSGLEPILGTLGLPVPKMPDVSARPLARGRSPINRGFADGGFNSLPKEAMFNRRHRIEWGEPETQGEWFIPRAKSKRGRSERILADVAEDFGFQLSKFADGGFNKTTDVPKPPRVKAKGVPGEVSDLSMKKVYDETVAKVKEYEDMISMSGVGATGLNPRFLSMFAKWNAALGNMFKIGSGWRSYESQARLYARWRAGVPGQAKAAPPGRSNHNRGLAIDLSPSRTTAEQRALGAHFGLKWPMSYEPWHVEPYWAANGGFHGKDMNVDKFDTGGTLAQGWNAIFNGTGAPEKLIRVDDNRGNSPVTVSVKVDMSGASVVGVADLENKLNKAGDDMARKISSALRKV